MFERHKTKAADPCSYKRTETSHREKNASYGQLVLRHMTENVFSQFLRGELEFLRALADSMDH